MTKLITIKVRALMKVFATVDPESAVLVVSSDPDSKYVRVAEIHGVVMHEDGYLGIQLSPRGLITKEQIDLEKGLDNA